MMDAIERRTWELVRKSAIRCNCGWNNGDHSPCCDMDAAWMDAQDQARDEAYELSQREEGLGWS
ncbi:MAG: hypothetical protein V3V08_23515 [Nannocystaceae bacterium]